MFFRVSKTKLSNPSNVIIFSIMLVCRSVHVSTESRESRDPHGTRHNIFLIKCKLGLKWHHTLPTLPGNTFYNTKCRVKYFDNLMLTHVYIRRSGI